MNFSQALELIFAGVEVYNHEWDRKYGVQEMYLYLQTNEFYGSKEIHLYSHGSGEYGTPKQSDLWSTAWYVLE